MWTFGIIIICIVVISLVWICWEIYNAPLMPDDYDLKEEDIWPLDQRPDTEEDANKEN
tara:strand:- start:1057 stop:1230 length:174 start_codon:yes stop_codon:yes gene_type:complete